MNTISFQRGPYGEILPPPLISHLTFEAAWKEYLTYEYLAKDQLKPDQFTDKMQGWTPDLISHIHTWRLRAVIAGTASNETEIETQLRACVNQGELLSLRPIGSEQAQRATFAPVLKRLGETSWQFGLPDHGRVLIFEAEVADVIEKAQHLYLRWSVQENPEKYGLRAGRDPRQPPAQNDGESA